MDSLSSILRFFTEQMWAIPVIGALVASLAFLAGRRWITPRPPTVTRPIEEETNLETARLSKRKSDPDRRSAPRRKGNRVEVFLTDDLKRSPIHGWVVDRSMGGLCLMVEKALTEGEVWQVRPRQAPQTAPWTAIEIRSCRADGGEWEVGCRFVKPPQWNDLLLFG
jgi:hypothetical protein